MKKKLVCWLAAVICSQAANAAVSVTIRENANNTLSIAADGVFDLSSFTHLSFKTAVDELSDFDPMSQTYSVTGEELKHYYGIDTLAINDLNGGIHGSSSSPSALLSSIDTGTLVSGLGFIENLGLGEVFIASADPYDGGVIGFDIQVAGDFASYGLAAGQATTYTWSTAGNFDSLTIVAVPEPSSAALLAVVGMGSLLRRNRLATLLR